MAAAKLESRSGRRKKKRFVVELPLQLRYKGPDGEFKTIAGTTISLHDSGVSCKLTESIPPGTFYAYLGITTSNENCQVSGRVMWVRESGKGCGVHFEKPSEEWREFVARVLNGDEVRSVTDRRASARRRAELP